MKSKSTDLTGTIEVTSEKAIDMDKYLNSRSTERLRSEVVFDEEVVFSDGHFMVVQVVSSEEPSECGWTQGVLFNSSGSEIGNTDVGESFLGEYTVFQGDKKYTAVVKVKE